MPSIEPGLSAEIVRTVTTEHTAESVGSGASPVLATPTLVLWCEQAAVLALQDVLGAEQETVGVEIGLRHLAATPIGMQVRVCATLESIDGRRLRFAISAQDEREPIADGTHDRVVIDSERFRSRAAAKRP